MKTNELLNFLEGKGLLSEDDSFTIINGKDAFNIPLSMDHTVIIKDCTSKEAAVFIDRCKNAYRKHNTILILNNENIFKLSIEEFDNYKFEGKITILFDCRKMEELEGTAYSIDEFNDTVHHLLAPDGCPWDRSQDHKSLRTYFLQETCEVIDSIDRNDIYNLREELGDVLFQIVFHAALAEKEGYFSMQDVVDEVNKKMIRRHPFVFNPEDSDDSASSSDEWEKRKRIEKNRYYLLSGVPKCLPSLLLACIIQKKVSSNELQQLFIPEGMEDRYVNRLRGIISSILKTDRVMDNDKKAGYLLFILSQILQEKGIDPELSLRCFSMDIMNRVHDFEIYLDKLGYHLSDRSPEKALQFWKEYLS